MKHYKTWRGLKWRGDHTPMPNPALKIGDKVLVIHGNVAYARCITHVEQHGRMCVLGSLAFDHRGDTMGLIAIYWWTHSTRMSDGTKSSLARIDEWVPIKFNGYSWEITDQFCVIIGETGRD